MRKMSMCGWQMPAIDLIDTGSWLVNLDGTAETRRIIGRTPHHWYGGIERSTGGGEGVIQWSLPCNSRAEAVIAASSMNAMAE